MILAECMQQSVARLANRVRSRLVSQKSGQCMSGAHYMHVLQRCREPLLLFTHLGHADELDLLFASAPAFSETCRLNCHYRLSSNDTPTFMAVVP